MKPRVFLHAGQKGKGSLPYFGSRKAGAASPHTHREWPGPAAPEPARDGAGARGAERHRQPHRAPSPGTDTRIGHRPMPGRGHPRSRRPEPPAPSRSCRWCLALSAAAAWQGPRSAALRCAMAPRRPGARRVRAGAGLGGTGSRGQEEEKEEAGPAAPPLLTPPGRGRAPAPAASRRMRFSRGITALLWYTGARVGLHVLEMWWRVSGSIYGNTAFWAYPCGNIR